MAETLSPSGIVIPQQKEAISAAGVAEMRTLGASANTAIAAKADTSYVDAETDAARFAKGRLSGNNDVFTLAPGVHTVGSRTSAENTANLPEIYPGTLVMFGNPDEPLKAVLFFPYNRDYYWWNVTMPGSAWMGWQRVGTTGDMSPLGSGVTNALLVQDFSRRHGGAWSTGGKGAVSFRLDHGLANVRDNLLPMFRAAGIVPSLALNSRNWDRPENGGVTAQQVDDWVSAGEVEIWNHGATHSNPTTEAAVRDEVVTGLAELRAQLPSAQIDGWAIPGVGTDPYLGMGTLTSVQQIYESYAGRLILEHHAVTTGHIGETWQRVLDGEVRQAQRHYGLDSRTPADAIAQIDYAIKNRTGLQLMVHPSVVDGEGNISTAGLQQVVDYMVQKRDAGELVICSPYQMMVADATIPAGVDVDAALAAYRSAIA